MPSSAPTLHISVAPQVNFLHSFTFPIPHRFVPHLRPSLFATERIVSFTNTFITNVLCCRGRTSFLHFGLLRRRATPVKTKNSGTFCRWRPRHHPRRMHPRRTSDSILSRAHRLIHHPSCFSSTFTVCFTYSASMLALYPRLQRRRASCLSSFVSLSPFNVWCTSGIRRRRDPRSLKTETPPWLQLHNLQRLRSISSPLLVRFKVAKSFQQPSEPEATWV